MSEKRKFGVNIFLKFKYRIFFISMAHFLMPSSICYIIAEWFFYIIIYHFFGGSRGVMVIVVGNGHGDTSSNAGRDWLHFI